MHRYMQNMKSSIWPVLPAFMSFGFSYLLDHCRHDHYGVWFGFTLLHTSCAHFTGKILKSLLRNLRQFSFSRLGVVGVLHATGV